MFFKFVLQIKAPKLLDTTTPHSDDDDDKNSLSNLNTLNAKEIDKGFLASGMNHLNIIGKEMLMLPHLTRKPNAKPIILPPSTIKEDITTSLPVEKLTVPANTAPMPNAVTFDTTIRDFTISSNINSITNNFLGNVPNTLQNSFFQQLSPNDYDDNSYEFESKEKRNQTEEDSNQKMPSVDTTSEETTSRETLGTDKDESGSKEQASSGVISSETQIDEQSSPENANDKSSSEEQTADDSMGEDTIIDHTLATDSKSSENRSKGKQSEESKEKDSSSEEDGNEMQISKDTDDNINMFDNKDILAQDNGGSNEVEIIKQAELDYDDSFEFEHILTDDKFKTIVATSLTLPEKIKSKESTETSDSNAISVENNKISSHDSYDSDEQNSAPRSVEIEGKSAHADTSNSFEFNSAEASNSGDHSSEIVIELLKNRNSKQEGIVTKNDSENVSDKVRLSLGNNHGNYSYEDIRSKSASDDSDLREQTEDKSQLDSATIENKSNESDKSSEEHDDSSIENDKNASLIIQESESSESGEDYQENNLQGHGNSESKENSNENDTNEVVPNSKSETSSETEESKESGEVSTLTETSNSDKDSLVKVNSNENSIERSDILQDEHVNSDGDDKSSLTELESEESKEDSEQDRKENSGDNVGNSSNNPSSDGSYSDEQTEESSEYFEHQYTSKQSESGDSSLVNMGVKDTDDSFKEKNSNEESTKDIDDNSKADQTSIENLGKDVIRESDTSESSNNDDTSTESGEDSMINIFQNIKNKSSNDKSQPVDSNKNDSNDESKSKESVSSELASTAQQIQSFTLESKEKGDEGSSEENTVNSDGQDSKIISNELGSNQSEKDESSESENDSEKQSDDDSSTNLSEDSEEKSNENSKSVNDDNSNETSDESMDIYRSESNGVSNENSEISHESGIVKDQSGSDENQNDSSERRDQDSSEHSGDISNNVSSLKSKETDENRNIMAENTKQHRSSEQDGSNQHADKDDSSQHSEQNDLSQESGQEALSQLLTPDKSNQHSEQDDSSEESKQDDPSQRSKQDDSNQHSKQDDSSQHSKQDDSSQESDQEASSKLLTQVKSNQHSEENKSSQESEQDERSEKSTENMAANQQESSEHNEKEESSEEISDEGKVDKSSDDTSDESNKSKNPDHSVSKESLKMSSGDSTKSDESTEENRAYNDASASKTDADYVDYNYSIPLTSQYSDLYSSFYYYDDLLKSINNNKNLKETTDSINTKVEVGSQQNDSGEKSRESKKSNDTSIQSEVKRPSSKQGSDENVEETAGTPLKESGDYYDDNMYFDFLSGLLEKSRVNDDKNQQRSSIVSNDEHQASEERKGNINNDDSKEVAPVRTDGRGDSTEIQDSNGGSGAIYTHPWTTEQHSQRYEPVDAMSQFFNFAVTRNPMENGVIHGITNGFNSVMTTTRPVVPAADYDDDDNDSQRGRSFGFVGATDDQRGGISSLHNRYVQDNTYTHNRHFSLNNNNAHTGSFESDMFSGSQNLGHFDSFERTNIQQNIPSLNNDQSFSFSSLNKQPENDGSYNGHSQEFVGHIDGSVHNSGNFDNQWPMQGNNFQGNWNQNLHHTGSQQWNPQRTGNEQSRTESSPATENSLHTNSLSSTGFDLLSSSPSATRSGLSPSISSHTSNEPLPSSSSTPQNSGSEHWSMGDMQASPIEASRQDRNIFLDPQTNYFSNSVHRNAFGSPNDQLNFNINFINGNNQMAGNQQTINNQPVVHDQQFYGDNNQFSVQSGNGASFGMVQNIPTSSQQVHVTNEDSDERNDETSIGLHKPSLSSIVQPSNVYRNPYADDNSDDHHESHQYANHNQGRSTDENNDSSENSNENEDDTDR